MIPVKCDQYTLVKQANNDANVLIIETAIEQFNSTTIVVGEDLDLLTAWASTENITFCLKPGKLSIKRKYIQQKVYLIKQKVKIM